MELNSGDDLKLAAYAFCGFKCIKVHQQVQPVPQSTGVELMLEEFVAFLQMFPELIELESTKTMSLSLIPLLPAEITDACQAKSNDYDSVTR